MRIALLAIAATLAWGPALAQEAPLAPHAGKAATNAVAAAAARVQPRAVYICDQSAVTRRSFERQYGSAEFITAAEALQGANSDAPRCMTRSEARKLLSLASR